MLQRFSICILILGITAISTACTNPGSGSITIKTESKFDNMFKDKSKVSNAPNIIYLGEKNNSSDNLNDISFEFRDLQR